MAYIETSDKVQLFYNDWGSGRPVVLIHGWPLNSGMWEYQAPVLAQSGYRVIAYDRRGFGKSDQPWTGYDYDTLADDLDALMTKLNLREATLVGFSMGGGEVARYLSRHGTDRVAQAALISSVTPFMLKTADNPDGLEAKVFDEFVDKLREDRPAFLSSFGKKFYGAGLMHGGGVSHKNVSDEILQWTLMMAMQGSPKATINCVHAFGETDFRPRHVIVHYANHNCSWDGRHDGPDRSRRSQGGEDDPRLAADRV